MNTAFLPDLSCAALKVARNGALPLVPGASLCGAFLAGAGQFCAERHSARRSTCRKERPGRWGLTMRRPAAERAADDLRRTRSRLHCRLRGQERPEPGHRGVGEKQAQVVLKSLKEEADSSLLCLSHSVSIETSSTAVYCPGVYRTRATYPSTFGVHNMSQSYRGSPRKRCPSSFVFRSRLLLVLRRAWG